MSRESISRFQRGCARIRYLVPAGLVLAVGVAHGATVPKVTICHFPPGNAANAQVITVGQPAVAAHVANHNDAVCPAGDSNCCFGGSNPSACTDFQTDVNNCGSCGNVCATGLVCAAGTCVCPPGHSFDDACYAFVPGDQDATVAEQDCVTQFGGHLASIHSQAEDNFISQLVDPTAAGNITAWIGGIAPGGFCSGPAASYAWTDGTPWDFQNWRSTTSEPNCTGIPGCTQFWPDTNGFFSGWNDVPCDVSLNGFVCKFQP